MFHLFFIAKEDCLIIVNRAFFMSPEFPKDKVGLCILSSSNLNEVYIASSSVREYAKQTGKELNLKSFY